ncbi:AlbA family DNA-binding domain-containing protein [Streptomyces spirodelae]|uniref:ATP-binding protein n=1 Tax=Streptomyces spirodelae TaxID=2812904 RepID=A0ABS3WW45_9ACTN|nr:ATP-binding protein [Streptomyces spirodelae]MBO8187284.1 ATP-binding protein [Streptomyces spirodelae]
MALNIDQTSPFRSPLQLRALVEAVKDAGEHDENDWIEWKSNYDLSEKKSKALLARHILAMANRSVERSRQAAGGFGYILVGVEPGNLAGVETIDLADLESGIRPYLGPLGPEWIPSYATIEGREVLVIAVDPPKQGDRIHTLEKEFDRYYAGMIFVRRTAQTALAGPGEVLSLTQRAQTAEERQSLTLSVQDEPVSVPSWPWLDEILKNMLEEERREVEANSKRKPSMHPRFASGGTDSRTDEEYADEVREYLEEYNSYLFEFAVQAYVRRGHGALRLRLHNSQERSYQQVRVEVDLPQGISACLADDYSGDDIEPPIRPIPLGEKNFFSSGINYAHFNNIVPAGSTLDLHARVEGRKILCDVSSLRAEEVLPLPVFHLMASPDLGSASIPMPWSITAVNAVGRTKGAVNLELGHTIERNAEALGQGEKD